MGLFKKESKKEKFVGQRFIDEKRPTGKDFIEGSKPIKKEKKLI